MPVPDVHRPHPPARSRPGPSRPTRVSPKGQVTVPKPVRDYLGLGAGSAVEFEVTDAGDVVLRKRPDTARPLRGLLAAYALDGPAPTTTELDEGVAREVGRLDAASRGTRPAGGDDASGPGANDE